MQQNNIHNVLQEHWFFVAIKGIDDIIKCNISPLRKPLPGACNMAKHTKESIIQMCKEQQVEFIRLQFTDIFGTLKNVAITVKQLEKALNNEIMFDGSSIEGFVRIEESDMILYPDPNTFVIYPWGNSEGKVARLICDV